MYIAHPAAELTRGVPGRFALPLPVTDVEGHAQAQLKVVGALEELLQRFDPSALGALVVLHQQ
ncbi:hypothetical protein D3C76_1329500 [compost metagenome]